MTSARALFAVLALSVTALGCAGSGAQPEGPGGDPGACYLPAIDPCKTDGDCERLASDILAQAITRLAADDAGVPVGQTRVARCVAEECRYAFAIDDHCYAGTPGPTHEIDCARSDVELLRAAQALRSAGDNFAAMPCGWL